MLLFCPSCGERFEIPGHEEANVAHKCPACGVEFGGERAATKDDEPAPPKLKFTSGGETSMDVGPRRTDVGPRRTGVGQRTGVTRGTPVPGAGRRAPQKLEPDKCELDSEISRDGSGVLFEARDTETGKPVVVRQLLPEGGSVADAQRWALAATKLQNVRHHRLVSVLGVGLREGSPHTVVERVSGQNLAEMTGGGRLGARQAAQLTLQIVEALSAAHGVGSVHGDLKPSNIMIDTQGRARVTDFGMLPRALKDGELEESAHVAGWMPFAAPELVRDGPEAADERSDSYSIGALLYFMLTGKAPFEADELRTLSAAVLEETPVAPSVLNPKVPADLDALIMRALEKDPNFRPANAQAVAVEIRRVEKAGLLAARKRRWVRAGGGGGGRWLKALALIVVLGGGGFGAYWFINRAWKAAALSRAKQNLTDARALEKKSGLTRNEDAIALYREAAKEASRSPEEARYLVEYARALLRAGKVKEALEILERAAALKSQDAVDAKVILPSALARAGRLDEARKAWDELGGPGHDSLIQAKVVEEGLGAADDLLDSGGDEDARDVLLFLRAVSKAPGAKPLPKGVKARMRAALGDAFAALGKTGEARAEYCAVLTDEETPGAGRVWAADGLERLASGPARLELSAEEMAALTVSPLAQARYARTLLARGHAQQAGVLVSTALSSARKGTEARAWADLAAGEADEASGRFDSATLHFENAASIAAKLEGAVEVVALARVGKARVGLRLGRAAASTREFQAIAERHATNPRTVEAVAAALVGAGDALRVTSQPGEASRSYRKVITAYGSHRPSYLQALAGIGEIQIETRSREKARDTFAKLATEGTPGVFGLIGQMMNGATGTGELAEAAEREGPDIAARAFYCAGLRHELDGRADQARDFFKRAAEAAKDVSWYRLLATRRMQE
ncbi:MAG: protein kinase domain-containing protein [Planctomycetota bacterium]|jgi:tetratricopeptide (TPR) repeat protein